MTVLKINSFTGMIPRLPPERLPDGAATYAENCDFAYGELRSLRGVGPKRTTSIVVKSLFTYDGDHYFCWPSPTRAYLAPTIDDTWGRVYYCSESGGLRVAQKSTMKLATDNPGPPSVSYKVGVKPATSGGYAATKALESTVVFAQVVSADGVVLKELDVTSLLTPVVYWERYAVTPPSTLFDDVSDGTARAPDGDGWVQGTVNVEFTYDEGGSKSEPLLANAWWINSAGEVKSDLSGGGTVTRSTVSSITHNGVTYSPSSDLFAALVNGKARTSAVRFRAKITFADTGVVFYDGVIPNSETSPGTFTLSVPESVTGSVVSVACVATIVNDVGEESAPYGPAFVEWRNNGTEAIEFSVNYTPDADHIPITGVNFYRTYPGNSSTDYFLVNATPVPLTGGVATLQDSSKTPQNTSVLQSTQWDEPPPSLKYLTYAGNGIFAGAVGKDLCLSEPFRPHAWPYRMQFPHEIKGIIEVEGGILVTTATQPWFVYGAHPMQMTQQVLNAEQAGVNWRAMARLEGSAFYASRDGIVRVSGGQASIKESQQLFTRETWRYLYEVFFPNMVFAAWDGKLMAALDGYTAGPNAALFSLEDGAAYNTVLNIPGSTVTGFGISATTDQVGVLYTDGFAEFGSGEYLPLAWQSKAHEFPLPVGFAAGVVRYTGAFSLEIYADETLVHTVALPTGGGELSFRLPSIRPAKRWAVKFIGTGTVKRIELGSSFAEMKNG